MSTCDYLRITFLYLTFLQNSSKQWICFYLHNIWGTSSLVVIHLAVNLVKFHWSTANAESSKQASLCSLNTTIQASLVLSWDQKQDIPRSLEALLTHPKASPGLFCLTMNYVEMTDWITSCVSGLFYSRVHSLGPVMHKLLKAAEYTITWITIISTRLKAKSSSSVDT